MLTAEQMTTDIKEDELLWKCSACGRVYAEDYVGNFKGYVPSEIYVAYALKGNGFKSNDVCYPCFLAELNRERN